MLHGRARECAEIDRLIDEARDTRGGALVVRGEPGAGKTALLQYAVERSGRARRLAAGGTPSETRVAFSVLHQLVLPVAEHLDAIAPLPALALRSALGLAASSEHDILLIATGALLLLSELSDAQPVLVTVDDAQWGDPESLEVLHFVGRRIGTERVAMLMASTEVAPPPEGSGLRSLTLAGLDRDASNAVVVERAGRAPAPEVGAFLWEATGGNPLALRESVDALSASQLSGAAPIDADALPGTALQHALVARTRALPDPTQMLLLVAAAEGTGDLGLVLRAAARLDPAADATALEPAERAGIVSVDASRIAFSHPLLRAAVYQDAPFGQRQSAHRALADDLAGEADADRRTGHRSAAAVSPDDDVAEELVAAAARAAQRGGHASAAAALERASDLTSDSKIAGQRMTAAATASLAAGNMHDARVRVLRAAPLVTDDLTRAELEHARGLVEASTGDRRIALQTLLDAASPTAAIGARHAARILVDAAHLAFSDADRRGMIDVANRLAQLDLPEGAHEAFAANLMIALGEVVQGERTHAAARLEQSLAGAAADDPRQLHLAGTASMFVGDDRAASDLLSRAIVRARAVGAVTRLPHTLMNLAQLEAWFGNFATARSLAVEGVTLARDSGQEAFAAHCLALQAWIAAAQGRGDDVEALATEAIDAGAIRGARPPVALATWALALDAIGAGRWLDAIGRLEELGDDRSAVFHPITALLSSGDLVEAACRLDQRDVAAAALAGVEEFARAPWTRALAARCRALLADGDEAAAEYERALGLYAVGERRFDEARTQLLYGEFLRRARRRSDARPSLRAACEAFERMGAVPWADRARAELRATGETARKRELGALDELTPQQLQIVSLVAEGATNKEVAAQLFVSPRTVDYHLRNVFVKLGISSRAELIRLAR